MNDEEVRQATDWGRPGDLMWSGLIACFVAGVLGGVALATDHPTAAVLAIIVGGVMTQVLVGIAVVAFGVSLGIRHAKAKDLEGSETAPLRVPSPAGSGRGRSALRRAGAAVGHARGAKLSMSHGRNP